MLRTRRIADQAVGLHSGTTESHIEGADDAATEGLTRSGDSDSTTCATRRRDVARGPAPGSMRPARARDRDVTEGGLPLEHQPHERRAVEHGAYCETYCVRAGHTYFMRACAFRQAVRSSHGAKRSRCETPPPPFRSAPASRHCLGPTRIVLQYRECQGPS